MRLREIIRPDSWRDGELVGVEIEVENARAYRSGDRLPPAGWVCETDGSLRNFGVEFVSEPVPPDRMSDMLSELMTELLRARVDFHERCGVHVHLNVSDLQPRQVATLLVLYQMLEPGIADIVGRRRLHNIFCLSGRYASMYRERLSNVARLLSVVEDTGDCGVLHQRVRGRDVRYGSLSLYSLTQYGTIEFRVMESTASVDRLRAFLWFVVGLRRAALRDLDIDELIDDVSENPNMFVTEVFGEDNPALNYFLMERDVLIEGAREAQLIKAAQIKFRPGATTEQERARAEAIAEKLQINKEQEEQAGENEDEPEQEVDDEDGQRRRVLGVPVAHLLQMAHYRQRAERLGYMRRGDEEFIRILERRHGAARVAAAYREVLDHRTGQEAGADGARQLHEFRQWVDEANINQEE